MIKSAFKYISDATAGILAEIVYAIAIMSACFILGAIIVWWLA